MKMIQQNRKFNPITIVLETPEEASVFWDLMLQIVQDSNEDEEFKMAVKISNWIRQEVNLGGE